MIIISQNERIIVNTNTGLIFTDEINVNYCVDGKQHTIGVYDAASGRALEVVKNIYQSCKLGWATYEMPKK